MMPLGGNGFVPDAFTDTKDGRGITWGLCFFRYSDDCSYLARFDCDLSQDVHDKEMKGRITSYNVCYTKLLRIAAKLISLVLVLLLFLAAFYSTLGLQSLRRSLLNTTGDYLEHIGYIKASELNLSFQDFDRITSYNVCYTKLLRIASGV